MTINRTVPMFIGESLYIDFNFAQELRSGQTVVSATYTVESPLALDGGTEAVNSDGTIAQARFTLPGTAVNGAQYTATCTATCTNPTETRISFATIRAQSVPT